MSDSFDPYHRWLGIPSEDQPPNHYRLLGIDLFEDQPEVIEYAASRQMAHLRTFQVGPHAALSQRLINEVAAAKRCLLKAEKKAAYDGFLRGRLEDAKHPSALADEAGKPPPFPVAPPDEEPPVVELGVSGEGAGERSPQASSGETAQSRRRWKVVTAVTVAVGLVLTIVVLAATLTSAPALPVVDETVVASRPVPKADVEREETTQPSAPSMQPVPPSTPSVSPDAGDLAEMESEFWDWIFADEANDAEPVAATVPKPPDATSPANGAPKPPAGTPDAKGAAAPDAGQIAVGAPKQAGMSPPPGTPFTEPPPKRVEWKSEPFKTSPQIDPILAEAWTLIRRGEYAKGRDRLVHAAKTNHDDMRVPFSLGLVDALVTLEWAAAEKEFLQCVQEYPGHVASLNNLALVRLRLNRESQSVRHWQAALAVGPPPDEIVQNLGRVRYLLQKGRLSCKPATQKAVNGLFVDAQRTGTGRFDENVGFRYMSLYGGGNPEFGWSEAHDYEDRWCPVCNAQGRMKCPERDCRGGTTTRMQSNLVGRNPLTKTPIYESSAVRVPCPRCKGSGWVPCEFCRDGKDTSLK